MTLVKFSIVLAVAAAWVLAPAPAQARKACWVDHYHNGGGVGRTKRAAKRAAKRAWEDFVAFEYGNDWGHYGIAKNKGASCSGSMGRYECNVSAIPCHRVSSRRRRR